MWEVLEGSFSYNEWMNEYCESEDEEVVKVSKFRENLEIAVEEIKYIIGGLWYIAGWTRGNKETFRYFLYVRVKRVWRGKKISKNIDEDCEFLYRTIRVLMRNETMQNREDKVNVDEGEKTIQKKKETEKEVDVSEESIDLINKENNSNRMSENNLVVRKCTDRRVDRRVGDK